MGAWMAEIDARAFGKLEGAVESLNDRIDVLEKKIERLDVSISNLTSLLERARGVRWFLTFTIGAASFLAGIAAAAKGLIK